MMTITFLLALAIAGAVAIAAFKLSLFLIKCLWGICRG